MRLIVVLLVLLPFVFGGCLSLVFTMVQDMGEPAEPVGLEYYRYEGETKAGEQYRVRYLLDPATKRRYVVSYIAGKLFRTGWDNVAGEIETASRVYGVAWEGKSEEEVRTRFGAPGTVTEVGDVRMWWYAQSPKEVDALLFRAGHFIIAYRTTQAELSQLLRRPLPY